MAYQAKAYTLREESTESGKRYFISFKDGQGKHHKLEVSDQLFFEFRQMERRDRNLHQWNQRHREFNEVWVTTKSSIKYYWQRRCSLAGAGGDTCHFERKYIAS